jgi:hypothetical protein
MEKDLNQRIQERAYEIWEREGRSGSPEDHWFRAEQELRQGPDDRSEATVQDATPADARRAEDAANPERSGSTL